MHKIHCNVCDIVVTDNVSPKLYLKVREEDKISITIKVELDSDYNICCNCLRELVSKEDFKLNIEYAINLR